MHKRDNSKTSVNNITQALCYGRDGEPLCLFSIVFVCIHIGLSESNDAVFITTVGISQTSDQEVTLATGSKIQWVRERESGR